MKLISDEEIREAWHRGCVLSKDIIVAQRLVAIVQLASCLKEHDAIVQEIFEGFENKAHQTDLIDHIRINLDWLDYQALKKKRGVK